MFVTPTTTLCCRYHVHLPAHIQDKFVLVEDESDPVLMAWAVMHEKMRLPEVHLRFCRKMAEEYSVRGSPVFWSGH